MASASSNEDDGKPVVFKEDTISVFSWNVNGILKFQIDDILKKFQCSILALQETKVTRLKLPANIALIEDYSSYFSFNQHKPVFNGVATYCQDSIKPYKVEQLMSELNMQDTSDAQSDTEGEDNLNFSDRSEQKHALFADRDGRIVVTEHRVEDSDRQQRRLVVFNLYSPYVNREESDFDVAQTVEYKAVFHKLVSERAKSLVKSGSFVLIVGDLNTVHKAIDQGDDGIKQKEWDSLYGERIQWMKDLLADGFKDTFRLVHPNRSKAFTCWNTKLNARENNYGTRLDYILADNELSKYLLDADIHPDVPGSDHCPVSATFHLKPVPSDYLPECATKFYIEFKKKQSTLVELFQRCEKSMSTSTKETTGKTAQESQEYNPHKKRKLESHQPKQSKLSDFFTKKHKPASKEDSIEDSKVPAIPRSSDSDVSSVNEHPQVSSVPFESQIKKPKTEVFQWPKPPKTVLCKHNEPSVLKTVKKKGPNQGRSFYCCVRGKGAKDDPNADCGFFAWR